MAKHRVERLGNEVQKEIADILSREVHDPRIGMVSVVAVDIAPDGCSAKIYISPLVGNADKKAMEAALKSASGFIRRELGKRLKTRVIPELFFHVDDSIAYGVMMSHRVEEQVEEDERAAQGREPIPEGLYKD